MFVVVAENSEPVRPQGFGCCQRRKASGSGWGVPSNANATTVSFIHDYVEMLDFIAEEISASGRLPLRQRAVICSGRTKQFIAVRVPE
jgi:hypothetical protein